MLSRSVREAVSGPSTTTRYGKLSCTSPHPRQSEHGYPHTSANARLDCPTFACLAVLAPAVASKPSARTLLGNFCGLSEGGVRIAPASAPPQPIYSKVHAVGSRCKSCPLPRRHPRAPSPPWLSPSPFLPPLSLSPRTLRTPSLSIKPPRPSHSPAPVPTPPPLSPSLPTPLQFRSTPARSSCRLPLVHSPPAQAAACPCRLFSSSASRLRSAVVARCSK